MIRPWPKLLFSNFSNSDDSGEIHEETLYTAVLSGKAPMTELAAGWIARLGCYIEQKSKRACPKNI